MEKILSISVAAYNLGEMIRANIESFCRSKVADKIELIITDDGSKDNTPVIVEEYVKQYPNTVKLIRQANAGPGSTVNSGIKNAIGKYFRMVDGDDWVDTDNLVDFVNLLEKTDADMVVSDYQIFDNQKLEIIGTKKYDLPQGNMFNFSDKYINIPHEMHAVTFRTEILQKNKIQLDNCFYTDVEYLLYPIPFVKTVEYFNQPIYIYRIAQAGQSVSVSSMKKNVNQHGLVLTNLLNWFIKNKKNFSLGQEQYLLQRIGDMGITHFNTLLLLEPNRVNKNKIKVFIKEMKQDIRFYKVISKSVKYRALHYSNYLLYPFIAKKYQKKREK